LLNFSEKFLAFQRPLYDVRICSLLEDGDYYSNAMSNVMESWKKMFAQRCSQPQIALMSELLQNESFGFLLSLALHRRRAELGVSGVPLPL